MNKKDRLIFRTFMLLVLQALMVILLEYNYKLSGHWFKARDDFVENVKRWVEE